MIGPRSVNFEVCRTKLNRITNLLSFDKASWFNFPFLTYSLVMYVKLNTVSEKNLILELVDPKAGSEGLN